MDFYAPDDEYGIIWDDPEIGIDWPIADPNLSDYDSKFVILSNISDNLL
ncbi:dTDP-4-dehydrorhamnose 3,5-epimerase family protein [Thermodesulfobacteriota bacterium]